MGSTEKLYERAKQIIPGGTQLLSKNPNMHAPGLWPAYYEKASGITITDLDNREFKDFSFMGIGACVLGYRDEDVDQAVIKAISRGSVSTLNCREEVELAELLLLLHSWADQARFTRSGGEAMAAAVRIARAATRRTRVVHCGYHGWHDWHLASGVMPMVGVPRQLIGTAFPFQYNCGEEELERIIQHTMPAAVVMEPIRYAEPRKGWLEFIRRLTDKTGTVLIFDEISSGFRFNLGGVHLAMGIEPDIAVFSKAMGNGYPIAAILGNRDVMKGAEQTFLSSTTWSERTGYAAAIATIGKMWAEDIFEYTYSIGDKVARALGELGVQIAGRPQMMHLDFGSPEKDTLYTQLMLEKGYLAGPQFYPSFAHTPEETYKFIRVATEVIASMSNEQLRGPVAEKGFTRLT